MKKRRVTLNLDEDIVQALEAVGGRSLSAVANEALREAVAGASHRSALLHWLDSLDREFGPPAPADLAAADRILDEAEGQLTGGAAA